MKIPYSTVLADHGNSYAVIIDKKIRDRIEAETGVSAEKGDFIDIIIVNFLIARKSENEEKSEE